MRFGVSGGRASGWSGRVRVLASVVVLGVALTVAGCSADRPEPVATPSVGVDVTPTPTPSAGPERPVEMDREDLDGAKAAAEYFFALYPYVFKTGDLETWTAMSDPECIYCAGVVESVEELHGAGGHETGGDIVIEDVVGHEPAEGNEYYGVDLVISQEPSTAFDRSGAVVSEMRGGRFTVLLALHAPAGEWIVRGVSVERTE